MRPPRHDARFALVTAHATFEYFASSKLRMLSTEVFSSRSHLESSLSAKGGPVHPENSYQNNGPPTEQPNDFLNCKMC